MGSLLSKIYDDYEDYKYLCKIKNIKPIELGGKISFYNHSKDIIKSFTIEEHKEHKNSYIYLKFK